VGGVKSRESADKPAFASVYPEIYKPLRPVCRSSN